METLYSMDRAAYLLGVDEPRIRELVRLGLIETQEFKGQPCISKSEVNRVYSWFNEQLPAETPNGEAPDLLFEVDDPELLTIFEELKKLRGRIRNLTGKMQRLGYRVGRLQAMGAGTMARFWERASAVHPELRQDQQAALEEREGVLHIRQVRPDKAEEYADFRKRLQEMVQEGIRKGHLPREFQEHLPGTP